MSLLPNLLPLASVILVRCKVETDFSMASCLASALLSLAANLAFSAASKASNFAIMSF